MLFWGVFWLKWIWFHLIKNFSILSWLQSGMRFGIRFFHLLVLSEIMDLFFTMNPLFRIPPFITTFLNILSTSNSRDYWFLLNTSLPKTVAACFPLYLQVRKEQGVKVLDFLAKNPCSSCHPVPPSFVLPLSPDTNFLTISSHSLSMGIWLFLSAPKSAIILFDPNIHDPLFTYFSKVFSGVSGVT